MELADLTPEEKNRKLFESQKQTLDKFLENGAISEDQYHKSLNVLIDKLNPEYKK